MKQIHKYHKFIFLFTQIALGLFKQNFAVRWDATVRTYVVAVDKFAVVINIINGLLG